jgi:hypothetical protein
MEIDIKIDFFCHEICYKGDCREKEGRAMYNSTERLCLLRGAALRTCRLRREHRSPRQPAKEKPLLMQQETPRYGAKDLLARLVYLHLSDKK